MRSSWYNAKNTINTYVINYVNQGGLFDVVLRQSLFVVVTLITTLSDLNNLCIDQQLSINKINDLIKIKKRFTSFSLRVPINKCKIHTF